MNFKNLKFEKKRQIKTKQNLRALNILPTPAPHTQWPKLSSLNAKLHAPSGDSFWKCSC